MNHPERKEWIPLLFGEADAPTKQQLEAHLKSCPECAAEVNAWRRTVGRLDAWKLPKAQQVSRPFPVQPVAWAAAAAIVLGAFVAGRFTAPGFDAARLRAELKSELSAEIQEGFARTSAETTKAMTRLEAQLAASSVRNTRELAEDLVQQINNMRDGDREATEALFNKLQKQYNTDFVLLRRDLETLASTTDEEIESARLKLYEIAAAQSPTQ